MTDLSLWGLFVSSFISSTLLPGGSEVLLGYLAVEKVYPAMTLILTATAGNTLGGMVTFALGWLGGLKWPVKPAEKPSQQRAMALLQRFGVVVLLLSWLPVIGDPLCLIAGWLRFNSVLACLFILSGKAVRYLLIVVAVT